MNPGQSRNKRIDFGVAMEWSEIKNAMRSDLLARGLTEPRIRLSALDLLEGSFKELFPDFVNNPRVLLDVGKEAMSRKVASLKETGSLNGAESVLKQIFERLTETWMRPSVTRKSGSLHLPKRPSQRPPTGNAIRETRFKLGLPPIIREDSRILILGTLPGEMSLRLQQYYGDPNNQFWNVLSEVYGEVISPDWSGRVEFLHRNGLALWDVLRSAERMGSLDSAIKNEVANDFADLLMTHPSLRAIVFNGGNSQKLFRRHVERSLAVAAKASLPKINLPSTSPTPGKYVPPFEEKVSRWKILRSL